MVKERRLIEMTRELEVPLLKELRQIYGENSGWRICGATGVAFTRIVGANLGIPIGQNLEGEHLELGVRIFEPEERYRAEDHTYVKYFNGKGEVYFYDLIYRLLFENEGLKPGVTIIEKYKEANFSREVTLRHRLYEFSEEHPVVVGVANQLGYWGKGTRTKFLEGYVEAMNDERATKTSFRVNNLIVSQRWCEVAPVIKRFAPEWEE